MKLSEAGAERIANYEGFRAEPYWDIDHYSIGYGTRAKSRSDRVTRAEARERLRRHADGHVGKALRALHLPLTQNQFDASVSLGFNLGTGVFGDDWTFGQCLRAHLWEEAADAMLLYDKADGVPLAGLTRRRTEERALFLRKPPVAYSGVERAMLNTLKDKGASKKRHASAVAALRAQAHLIQTTARKENDWKIHDRGRRYQGLRRALRKYA